VAIDSSGTVKGLANFSIRGLGVTSSVPSLDPTVGTFVDGVYIGSNYGVILDTFDLEGIEILRGPQGLLFGRNVTGGAVLVNTRDPSHEYSARVKAGVETGLQTTIAGSVTGSIHCRVNWLHFIKTTKVILQMRLTATMILVATRLL